MVALTTKYVTVEIGTQSCARDRVFNGRELARGYNGRWLGRRDNGHINTPLLRSRFLGVHMEVCGSHLDVVFWGVMFGGVVS